MTFFPVGNTNILSGSSPRLLVEEVEVVVMVSPPLSPLSRERRRLLFDNGCGIASENVDTIENGLVIFKVKVKFVFIVFVRVISRV